MAKRLKARIAKKKLQILDHSLAQYSKAKGLGEKKKILQKIEKSFFLFVSYHIQRGANVPTRLSVEHHEFVYSNKHSTGKSIGYRSFVWDPPYTGGPQQIQTREDLKKQTKKIRLAKKKD